MIVMIVWVAAGIGAAVCAVGEVIGQASLPQSGLLIVVFVTVARTVQYERGRWADAVLVVAGTA